MRYWFSDTASFFFNFQISFNYFLSLLDDISLFSSRDSFGLLVTSALGFKARMGRTLGLSLSMIIFSVREELNSIDLNFIEYVCDFSCNQSAVNYVLYDNQ